MTKPGVSDKAAAHPLHNLDVSDATQPINGAERANAPENHTAGPAPVERKPGEGLVAWNKRRGGA